MTGGGGLVRETHLPPNSDFSSDFGHFILKIVKKNYSFGKFLKENLEKSGFGGDVPPEFRTGRGDASPTAAAHVSRYWHDGASHHWRQKTSESRTKLLGSCLKHNPEREISVPPREQTIKSPMVPPPQLPSACAAPMKKKTPFLAELGV